MLALLSVEPNVKSLRTEKYCQLLISQSQIPSKTTAISSKFSDPREFTLRYHV